MTARLGGGDPAVYGPVDSGDPYDLTRDPRSTPRSRAAAELLARVHERREREKQQTKPA